MNDLVTEYDNELNQSREHNRAGAGVIGIIFLIVNATLGAGLLNFPEAFDKSEGIATAIIAQLVSLIFIIATLIIWADCSDATNTKTMQAACASLCGEKSLIFCSVCVAIYSFGCCIAFLIIIGDQFDRVFATYFGLDYCHNWYLSRPFITSITSIIFILPLSFFKRLDVLTYASSIGCVTVIYVVWLIVYEDLDQYRLPVLKPMYIWPDEPTKVLQIVPIICFAYQSHMTAIPTYICMKNRSIAKFTFCAVISMFICFAAYTIVGIFGYATFGKGRVPSDILQGYSDKSATLTIAILAVAVKSFTTFPIVLYCGRDAVLNLFGLTVDCKFYIRFILTMIWFTLSLFVAILVPDISPLISLMGILSAAFIFMFPGICLLNKILQRNQQILTTREKSLIILSIFITALGAFACGVIIVEGWKDFMERPLEKILVKNIKSQLGESLCK